GVAPNVLLRTEIVATPKFFAFEVISVKASGPERDNDPLTIRHRRRRAIRIGSVSKLSIFRVNSRFPKAFSRGAIEAEQRATMSRRFLLLVDGLGYEDAISPDD